jgi:acid phosphatase family membrane protein YuiD
VEENFFVELVRNRVLIATFIAWLIAQTFKVIVGVIRQKRFDFRWFLGTGGMPSSHAASVCALATAVGITFGFYSPLFAVTGVFTIIVLFDAQGMRRTVGKQAEILNRILDDIYWKRKITEDRMKELLGHTPVEVLAGMVLGIVIAILIVK